MKKGIRWAIIILIPVAIVIVIFSLFDYSLFSGKNKSASVFFLPTTSFGTTTNFAVFGRTRVSNLRATEITGSLGVGSIAPITGFFGTVTNEGPGVVTGTIHENDSVAAQVIADIDTVYTALRAASGSPTQSLQLVGASYVLDDLTLTPGVYTAPDGGDPIILNPNKTITLDGTSDPTAAFIIRGGRSLSFGSNSRVVLVNTTACNVFWHNNSSVNVGGSSIINGTIVSGETITANAGVATGPTVYGRLLSKGTVSTDWARIIAPTCIPRGSLTVIKEVVNDYGGTATPADFIMTVTGGNVSPASSFPGSASGTTVTIDAGSYSVDELNVSGYTKTMSADCSGTLAAGEAKTCTITNTQTEPTATLTVIKNVVGGTKSPGDFTLTVTGVGNTGAPFPGDSNGTPISLGSGSYFVEEAPVADYIKTMSADCSGNITVGESKTCVVTNTYDSGTRGGNQGTLIVKKVVENSTYSPSDFIMNITGTNVSYSGFRGDSVGTVVTLDTGPYSVDETSTVPASFFSKSLSPDCSGTIAADETKTCTITNTGKMSAVQSVLIVIERIIGGPALPSDFTVSVLRNGKMLTRDFLGRSAPGTSLVLNAGDYIVSDQANIPTSDYSKSMSEECSGTLEEGDTQTCTITRTYRTSNVGQEDLLVIKKVVGSKKSPADFIINVTGSNVSLSSFPGSATGTLITLDEGPYSVDEEPVAGYTKTMSADCSGTIEPVAADAVKTCTITNTFKTGGGSSSNESIHIEKSARPTALFGGPGVVTYNYLVTNTGDSDLSDIKISDNKCQAIKMISGDVYNRGELDTDEKWTYQCIAYITQTTTNIVTVSGEARGKTVQDSAEATVVVTTPQIFPYKTPSTPKLPATGFPPQ